jgi:hypothetical protein
MSNVHSRLSNKYDLFSLIFLIAKLSLLPLLKKIGVDITAGWQRTVVGVSYEHFWSIGVISLGWINELSASWRVLQIIISAPTAIVLVFFW